MKRSAPHGPKEAAAESHPLSLAIPPPAPPNPKEPPRVPCHVSSPPNMPPAAPWFGRPQERKKELGSIQGELEARRAAFVERERESRRREAELEGQLAVAQAQLGEVRAAAAREKEEQLDAVLAGSQAVSGILR